MLGGISQSFVLGMRLPIIQVDEGQAIQQHLKFLRLKYGQVILWYNLFAVSVKMQTEFTNWAIGAGEREEKGMSFIAYKPKGRN